MPSFYHPHLLAQTTTGKISNKKKRIPFIYTNLQLKSIILDLHSKNCWLCVLHVWRRRKRMKKKQKYIKNNQIQSTNSHTHTQHVEHNKVYYEKEDNPNLNPNQIEIGFSWFKLHICFLFIRTFIDQNNFHHFIFI